MRVKVRIKDEDLKCEDTLSLEGRSERISHSRSVFPTLSYCPVVEIVETSEHFKNFLIKDTKPFHTPLCRSYSLGTTVDIGLTKLSEYNFRF